jgi:DNA-binding NtrC family response regulator
MTAQRLLIVEDDPALGQMLTLQFEDAGLLVACAQRCAEGLRRIQSSPVDLLLLDQQLPDGRGMDLIAPALELDPELPIVMMTGQHDLELAIEAIQLP